MRLTYRKLEKLGYSRDRILIIDEANADHPVIQARMNKILDKEEDGIVIFLDPLSAHTGWNVQFSRNIIQKAGAADRFKTGVLIQWAFLQRRAEATVRRHIPSIPNVLNYAIQINYSELSLKEKEALFSTTPLPAITLFGELTKLKNWYQGVGKGDIVDLVSMTKFAKLIQYWQDKD